MKRNNSKRHNSSGSQKNIKKDTPISSLSSQSDLVKSNRQWAHTRSTLYNLSFTWTIDNISFRQETLKSPIFWSDANDKIKWHLILHPRAENGIEDSFSIFLQQPDALGRFTSVFGKFKISILNTEPTKTYKIMDFSEVKRLHWQDSFGSPKFCKRSFLLDKTNGFCSEDKLKIFCEISFISDNIEITSQPSTVCGLFKNPQCEVTTDDDFGRLLGSQKFSDITLVVGEYEFQAHKAILAGRSKVFAAMFEHDMAEVKTGRVTITDIKREVLQEMINFIYTGKAPNLGEMTGDLLAAAEKYALQTLKVMCEKALFANLSIETAAETLVFADLYNANQLKELTIKFIRQYYKMIIKTKEWQNMKNSHCVLQSVLLKKQTLILPYFP